MPTKPDGITTKETITYEVKVYVGSRRRYDGLKLRKKDILAVIKNLQHLFSEEMISIPVRITKTNFIHMDYKEKGWEIAAINYPRKPREITEIDNFMLALGKRLCEQLEQNRVSVIMPKRTIMFESPNAEESHKQTLS